MRSCDDCVVELVNADVGRAVSHKMHGTCLKILRKFCTAFTGVLETSGTFSVKLESSPK